jgi:5-methylcytosine-specific restriction endonuclease McrA
MSTENSQSKFIYRPKTSEQLKKNYDSRIKKDLNTFTSFEDFLNWYHNEEKICHYCGLTELQSQEIVVKGLLTSNRFPQNGVTGQGKARGMWLEVDRIKPKDAYSEKNCVLACYFCNNDKSDVFEGEDYKLFFQNRYKFLTQLIENHKNTNR